jgi:excisionase family DNA binding protein
MARGRVENRSAVMHTTQPGSRWLLTVPEVAQALGVCRASVYELMLLGQLPSVKIGRARRVPLVALEAFIAQQLTGEQDMDAMQGGRGHGQARA